MDSSTFEQFRSLIYKESGIALVPEKQSLLESRIQRRIRALNVVDERDYFELIELDASGDELRRLIDSISTNVTFFFREPGHFDFLATLCAQWKREKLASVRIWCAAASSGEEPYTIAMTLVENLDLKQVDAKILSTDICMPVLERALCAVYTKESLRQIPAKLSEKYFEPVRTEDGMHWRVVEALRKLVLFKRLNLIQIPYPLKGGFNVIFCRNVMIYFDNPTRQRIVEQFEKLLAPGGYLVISNTETLLGINTNLKKCQSSVYQKPLQNLVVSK